MYFKLLEFYFTCQKLNKYNLRVGREPSETGIKFSKKSQSSEFDAFLDYLPTPLNL